MDKLKRYIDCIVPIEGCTLRCHYCYITCHRKFNNNKAEFKYTPAQIKAAMTKERLGGTSLINLCGAGETLIPEVVLDYVKVLLENGHYVMVVTNATISQRFDVMAQWPKELLERLFFKFSYHYLELKERNLLDRFFGNIKKMRDAGVSFTIEVTPNDELIPLVDECIERCVSELGAKPHCTVARDESDPEKLPILTKTLSHDEYRDFWGGKFESKLFEYKLSIFEVPRKEFCYAGLWSNHFILGTGVMKQCYRTLVSQDIVRNPDEPIRIPPIGRCQELHCYNGHGWIALGDIPELSSPTYAEMRNRICQDGSEWLNEKFKAFVSQRTCDNNPHYNSFQKQCALLNTARIKATKALKARLHR